MLLNLSAQGKKERLSVQISLLGEVLEHSDMF